MSGYGSIASGSVSVMAHPEPTGAASPTTSGWTGVRPAGLSAGSSRPARTDGSVDPVLVGDGRHLVPAVGELVERVDPDEPFHPVATVPAGRAGIECDPDGSRLTRLEGQRRIGRVGVDTRLPD